MCSGLTFHRQCWRQHARRRPSRTTAKKVEYQVGDWSKATRHPQGPFNVVLGSWFLNYAPDYATQLEMWKNIAVNLAPGGTFVGVVPPATEDPKAYTLDVEKERHFELRGISMKLVEEIPDGVTSRVTAVVKPRNVEFDQYHLKKSVYERAGREAGMKGDFDWRALTILDHVKNDPMAAEWQIYMKVPSCSILIVKKT